ncbi:MAG: S-adenosylmethionine decarboxylase proenzyme [Nanohaloarchaea archaeon]|nr:S-adenosylmethionine decarboxylase proenzyme [Candidatus Nanohaloarchaea archaeon]
MKDGKHLILDLKCCKNMEKLSDTSFIESFLLELVRISEMKAITKPKVLYYEHEVKEESGVTGFVIISDSHISIHTYPTKKALYLDIFSCKQFDVDKIVNYVRETFESCEFEKRLIER